MTSAVSRSRSVSISTVDGSEDLNSLPTPHALCRDRGAACRAGRAEREHLLDQVRARSQIAEPARGNWSLASPAAAWRSLASTI